MDAHHALWGEERIGHADADPKYDAMHLRAGRPLTDKWTFSTNCVSIQGPLRHPLRGLRSRRGEARPTRPMRLPGSRIW